MLIVAIIYSPRVFRLTRAVAGQRIVVMDYIEAAKLRVVRVSWYLIRKEILPNSTAPPLVAEFGLEFCFVFLLVAGLSFLGLGIQPPTADWGSMVRENATLVSFGDITPLIPAAAIALADRGCELRGGLDALPLVRPEGVVKWQSRKPRDVLRKNLQKGRRNHLRKSLRTRKCSWRLRIFISRGIRTSSGLKSSTGLI